MFFSPMSAPIFGGDEGYISVYKMVCVGFLVYKMVGPNVRPGVCSAIVGVLFHSIMFRHSNILTTGLVPEHYGMEKHPNNCRTYTWPDIRSNHFVDQKPNTYHFVDRDVTFITTKK